MKIAQLLTPITKTPWLSVTDTVRDAFDHMETHEVPSAPLVDWNGCYVGTVTEADLRRHVGRRLGVDTTLAELERRSHNPAVRIDHEVSTIDVAHRFIPVVDDRGKLLGIVDCTQLPEPLPSAA